MKKICFTLFLLLWFGLSHGQVNVDSILRKLGRTQVNDDLVDTILDISENYLYNKPDSAFHIAQDAKVLASQIKYAEGEARVLFIMGKVAKQTGDYLTALELYRQSQKIYQQNHNSLGEAGDLLFIGEVYAYEDNHPYALSLFFQAMDLYKKGGNSYGTAFSLLKIAESFESLSKPDSAFFYLEQIKALRKDAPYISEGLEGRILHTYGKIFLRKKDFAQAMFYYRRSLAELFQRKEDRTLCQVMLSMAELFQKQQQEDSCIRYANKSLALAQKGDFLLEVFKASEFLYRIFKSYHEYDNALYYLEKSIAAKNTLFSQSTIIAIENQRFKDESEKREIATHQQQVQNRNKIFVLLAAFLVLLFIAFILWRNNKQKHKANLLLQKQKQEIQKTLSELKAVQQQLIHTEKMASLGEVTAGIAHEIQNPLNFITNFSDVGNDLLQELKDELKTGDAAQALELTPMIEQSFQKISEHGQRADAIVKNMMQHARKNTGIREPADVNAIVGDCLRLSYQGARTKDSSFQANLKTQFDTNLGKISMVPQDMGRVLVNLFNNAFYSVQLKKKQVQNGYEPLVQVTTRKNGNSCEIRIKDNGVGIQEKVVDKIYQPFFTTKPAGEGTGLGLSMSYEIVTKTHGGQLKVNTQQGEYAEFIVELPLQ